jgi:uncharacterized protein (UPF0332 family)
MIQDYKSDYITYRIQKSKESIDAAKLLFENGLLAPSVNRLYYACFYMVDALLFRNNIKAKSHSGTKNQFTLHFVKTSKVSIQKGELYSELLDLRQEGDYGSKFEIGTTEVASLMNEVQVFVTDLERMLI